MPAQTAIAHQPPGALAAYAVLPCCALAIALVLVPGRAEAAGGPYRVEDADITDAGSCQLESWYSYLDEDNQSAVLSPQCTLGTVEWTLEALQIREQGEGATTAAVEAKALLRPVSTGSFGVAAMVGMDTGDRLRRLASTYAYLPVTLEPVEDLRLHLNLGSAYDRDDTQWTTNWAMAFDWVLSPGLNLLAERFGDDRGYHGWQIGLRPSLFEDVLELDLIWARDLEEMDGDWFTVGFAWAW